ncbi:MAG: hypothetical protein KF842_09225 [Caulobacter sp.]|nr:hypothetical protein [Caulobacter sp.]
MTPLRTLAAALGLLLLAPVAAQAQPASTDVSINCPVDVVRNKGFTTKAETTADGRKVQKLISMPLLAGMYYCSERRFSNGNAYMMGHEQGLIDGVRYRLDILNTEVAVTVGPPALDRLQGGPTFSPTRCAVHRERTLCSTQITAPEKPDASFMDTFGQTSVLIDLKPTGPEVVVMRSSAKASDPPVRLTIDGKTFTIPWKSVISPSTGIPVDMARLTGADATRFLAAVTAGKAMTVEVAGAPREVWPIERYGQELKVLRKLQASLAARVKPIG